MRTQKRNKRLIYLCQQNEVTEKGIATYKEPIPIRENYNATNSESDLIAMGMEYPKYIRIKTNNRIKLNNEWVDRKEVYHPGDKVYVYVEPPKRHDPLCKTADYEVDTKPSETINQLEIMLRNLSGKN